MSIEKKYFVIDTETGGLDLECSLLSLYGIVCDRKLKEIDAIDLKIKPDDGVYKIHAEALQTNNINIAAHEKEAESLSIVKKEFETFITRHTLTGEKLIVVGQNVHFDVGFIQRHLLPRQSWTKYFQKRYIDTAGLAMFLQMIGYVPNDLCCSLKELCKYFGVSLDNPHEAKEDCKATLEIFRRIRDTINNGNQLRHK